MYNSTIVLLCQSLYEMMLGIKGFCSLRDQQQRSAIQKTLHWRHFAPQASGFPGNLPENHIELSGGVNCNDQETVKNGTVDSSIFPQSYMNTALGERNFAPIMPRISSHFVVFPYMRCYFLLPHPAALITIEIRNSTAVTAPAAAA